MRNITCTNALLLAMAGAGLAATASAQPVPEGCFVRDYDETHLSAHPNQMVERLMLHFYPLPEGGEDLVWVDITADMASAGRAVREGIAGLRMTEMGGNFADPLQFGVECDGGLFSVARYDGDSLLIETDYVRVSMGGCGGDAEDVDDRHTSLAEAPGETTQYLLYRVDPSLCEAR